MKDLQSLIRQIIKEELAPLPDEHLFPDDARILLNHGFKANQVSETEMQYTRTSVSRSAYGRVILTFTKKTDEDRWIAEAKFQTSQVTAVFKGEASKFQDAAGRLDHEIYKLKDLYTSTARLLDVILGFDLD